ncbi:SMU1112c/YaeR family gloxylase I-like metalloprotein [Hymenobacter latericus]|uniref:SMU1112c/YaeR family gloxylase I-like metalloprotein n=1 Tax=Hymenobacter sp. YIM 151858-1 TaxID=2987688 RepID=UPI0022267619|nr:VOC family protein [Hymenobacter sp. YIM 151858-1]UYZ59488.1 VOC family protein [Hymenobacter sp. YIM 151858-1]
MLQLAHIHHVAIICSDYEASKRFYTEVLGLQVVREVYRAERESHKLDLALGEQYIIELFSFPAPMPRVSQPEAAGLRHLAFAVPHLDAALAELDRLQIAHEPVRTDEYTGKRFSFFFDPDGLPLELYEA